MISGFVSSVNDRRRFFNVNQYVNVQSYTRWRSRFPRWRSRLKVKIYDTVYTVLVWLFAHWHISFACKLRFVLLCSVVKCLAMTIAYFEQRLTWNSGLLGLTPKWAYVELICVSCGGTKDKDMEGIKSSFILILRAPRIAATTNMILTHFTESCFLHLSLGAAAAHAPGSARGDGWGDRDVRAVHTVERNWSEFFAVTPHRLSWRPDAINYAIVPRQVHYYGRYSLAAPARDAGDADN